MLDNLPLSNARGAIYLSGMKVSASFTLRLSEDLRLWLRTKTATLNRSEERRKLAAKPKPGTVRHLFTIAATLAIILFSLVAARSQTNRVAATNQPTARASATNAVRYVVSPGYQQLYAITNRIAALSRMQAAAMANQQAQTHRLSLQRQAGQIDSRTHRDTMDAQSQAVNRQSEAVRKEIARLKLAEMDVRARYGLQEKPVPKKKP